MVCTCPTEERVKRESVLQRTLLGDFEREREREREREVVSKKRERN